jgi:methylmalonyl-CoA mutase
MGEGERKTGRDEPWLFRTYSGHSSAQASNALYRTNLERGQTGLSIAFDLPTQTGYDSDHPLAMGEVGKVVTPDRPEDSEVARRATRRSGPARSLSAHCFLWRQAWRHAGVKRLELLDRDEGRSREAMAPWRPDTCRSSISRSPLFAGRSGRLFTPVSTRTVNVVERLA